MKLIEAFLMDLCDSLYLSQVDHLARVSDASQMVDYSS